MNKKELAHIRKQFKLDHDMLSIFDMLNVYIMKESSEIYHHEYEPFGMVDRDKQELYMANFKKLLGGELDQKQFELKFVDAEEPTQVALRQGLGATRDEWRDLMLTLVDKMLKETTYERDLVITFIRGEYFRPTKASNEEAETNGRDEMFKHPFILCSINTTEQQKKTLLFDYVERTFKYSFLVDPIIKLNAPEQGFFYPSVTDNASDINRILYCSGRANEPNADFISQVLNAERSVTALEERGIFEEIVKEVAGERLETSTLAQVYEEIHQMIETHEGEERVTLDFKDVERVLAASGVKEVTAAKVEQAFETVVDDRNYELNADTVMPKFTSKSIKIDTKVATITIRPQDLRYVRQVNVQGKRCLLIEIEEDAIVEGFTLDIETL